ncbi:MAG: fasciclin domain-containing protein [Caldilineaceae bacterium]
MLKRTRILSLLTGLAMILTITPIASAQFTPAIAASDQDVVDGTVVVKMVIANAPSWVVIHADANGKPGTVLGEVAVPEGASKDVVVPIDTEEMTDVLHAMLHDDTGKVGEYEFPTADPPTTVAGEVVMKPFNVTGESSSVIGAARENGNFNTLLAAIDAAGLTETLMAQDAPVTLFAPTDDAFAKIPQETLDGLLADKEALTKLLTYHVVPGVVKSSDLSDGLTQTTVEGEDITIGVSGSTVTVNDAKVTTPDIEASNGVIHAIDTVLMPASMAAPAESASASDTVTETAPISETAEITATEMTTSTAEVAESAAVTETETTTDTTSVAESAAVTETAPLTETETVSETEAVSGTTSAEAVSGMDIIDTAVAGEFNTLVTAVQTAGLVDALKGDGPFTVFAPSDDAFAKLPKATLDALLADPKGELTQVLLYHVVPGKVLSTDITDGMEVETLQGSKIKLTVKDGAVMVNDAKVVAVDIPATNGVIHVIDTVLMPAAEVQASTAQTTTTGTQPSTPQQMPQTGGSTNTMITLLIVGLVLAGLAGTTVLNRRRTA